MPRALNVEVCQTYQISAVRLITVPNFDVETGCDPYFTIAVTNTELYNSKVQLAHPIGTFCSCMVATQIYDYRQHTKRIRHYRVKDGYAQLDVLPHDLLVRGDVHLQMYDKVC